MLNKDNISHTQTSVQTKFTVHLKTKGTNHCIITFNEENSTILSKETEYIPIAVVRFNITPSGPAWFLIILGPPPTDADSFCLHIYAFHWGGWVLQEASLCRIMKATNSLARLPCSFNEVDQLRTLLAAKTHFGGQGGSASGNLPFHSY